ncbi:MAG TPA: zf-HC2 domain-containing protein [Solirubrobacteraceae bacterium]|nr:zf-HC2 domain-containing protein [Solirubrobacteraceae bacterium]
MSDYLDGDLAPAARARIEHHLAECEKCRRLLAGLRGTLGALRRLSGPRNEVEAVEIVAAVRVRLKRPAEETG